jgi:hypothetical protein
MIIVNSEIIVFNQLKMMLLMGMKSSLTIYPMPPMMANPMAHEVAIFLNSA